MPPHDAAPPKGYTALVLAAGRGTRFEGGDKLLADVGGVPLVRRVLSEVSAAPVGDIVLVVAEDGGRIAAAAGPGRWRTVINKNAAEGLSSSLRAGLAAVAKDTAGLLIVLADMPGMTADLIGRVIAAAEENPGAVVHPATADGRQGHPVLWPPDLFPEILALSGDKGAKGILARHSDRVVRVPAEAAEALADIDTRADLKALMARSTGAGPAA